ncbi:Transposon Ty3-I Gag-Pol polyprotein [Araneus ventricosus]|uniref:Transposon Ty3-I Gag-Pol polyprotein n=1 Tax=Araneus ventricosus TaxID=182803 RepID=A0A4Y2QU57_ARAVE|nr:Transposon Ty3-I Gag-Pol polyprotein [Araneus ventricosus]
MADKILEINPRTELASVKENNHNVDEIVNKISALELQIASLSERFSSSRTRSSSNSRARSRGRSRKRFDPNVDSGADVSLIPANLQTAQPCSFSLYAANGTEIPTYGVKTLTLDLGLRRAFQWNFIMAKVNRGIIVADFLNQFQLLIDIHSRKLIDGVTQLSIRSEIMTVSDYQCTSTLHNATQFCDLLRLFPDITKPNILNTEIKHDVKHYITTNGQPVHSRARPLNPETLRLAQQEFQFMLNNNSIRPSKSQWASSLHLVNKKDGTLRPCGDYRRLNECTIPDRYPIPRIEYFHPILKDKVIFSKIDLIKAYYQIPITEEDKPKTAIITPFGLYEFNVMSFGLRNAPATFQRFINEVFSGLDFLFPYLDDVFSGFIRRTFKTGV